MRLRYNVTLRLRDLKSSGFFLVMIIETIALSLTLKRTLIAVARYMTEDAEGLQLCIESLT